jgi:hypothetical protein
MFTLREHIVKIYMAYLIDKQRALLQHALDALHKGTGFAGQIIEQEPTIALEQGRAEARIEIQANGKPYRYTAEIKRIDRFAYLAEIKYRQNPNADPLLLVAQRITAELADKCRELDLQFIDAAGNAYLRQPGLFVMVKGQRQVAEEIETAEQQGKRAGTATNLRVFFALLCKPALINAPYREINQVAGVALGTIGWVFYDLNARGYLTGGKGERVLLERQRLAQEWVTNYPIKLRPKLNLKKFRAPTADWWKELDATQYGAQWGAEVAAAKLTGYLRPQTCTLYFHKENGKKNLTRLIAENKLRADPQGDIEILDAFWDFAEDQPPPETVPPLLVYADLLITLDPRNLEAAKIIYEQYIAADTKA